VDERDCAAEVETDGVTKAGDERKQWPEVQSLCIDRVRAGDGGRAFRRLAIARVDRESPRERALVQPGEPGALSFGKRRRGHALRRSRSRLDADLRRFDARR
jgi:hypothetical protein